MRATELDFCKRLAKGLAAQFGKNCEIVVHDLRSKTAEHSVVAIENGHVSGRKVGDGPSQVVLEAMKGPAGRLDDRYSYLTRTADGKVLKSSTIYLRDTKGNVTGIFSINYDITMLLAMEESLHTLTDTGESDKPPRQITGNVAALLDELIDQSVRLIGKPAAVMTKEEKIRAIRFLDDSGAFLVTRSGPKVCAYFGISKYTLYNYIDEARAQE
ncbi:MAG: transcriptional regulator [Lachnospiraceae bacterium]|nr:transcriptional regulator [Lachnospiraceae bacterium]